MTDIWIGPEEAETVRIRCGHCGNYHRGYLKGEVLASIQDCARGEQAARAAAAKEG